MDIMATEITVEAHYSGGEIMRAAVSRPFEHRGESLSIDYGASGFGSRSDTVGRIPIELETFERWLATLSEASPSPAEEGTIGLEGVTTQVDLRRGAASMSLSWFGAAPESWRPFEEVAARILGLACEDSGLQPAGQ
jgi:hypothetical protein